jgi:hypothetical protein
MPEVAWVAVVVSSAAFVVSLVTMWATLFRRGRLRMTQPTSIFFGPDGNSFDGVTKIYLRFLLYTTGKRGVVIENMAVEIQRNESVFNFTVWVFGNDKLSRGAGLFVSDQGFVANHHFLQLPDAENFRFDPGQYKIRAWADIVGVKTRLLLFENQLDISINDSDALKKPDTGIYFDWGPGSRRYISHIEEKRPEKLPPEIEGFLKAMVPKPKASDKE